jgi:hypothetical protein
MTTTSQALIAPVRSYWDRRSPIERISFLIGAVLVASGIFHFGVFFVRGGPWEGPVSWRKPTTFGLSFGLTLIAITWVTSYLVLSPRLRSWLLGIFAADCIVEVGGISLQAWRHVPSHFNTETPFNQTVAMSLAVGGAVLVIVLGTFAGVAFRGRIQGASDMRLALRAGFAILLAGLATGVAMIVKGSVLIRYGERQAAYDTAGSLKPVHFVTLHAILVLPALSAWLVYRGWREERRRRALVIAVGLYLLATLVAVLISLV